MRDDEQVYRIEQEVEVEDVSGLSAHQVGCLVLSADPEAMHRAATDYLRTAERLEATADGLRHGAADLADGWQGSAADESQHHLQQYYATARSLATACRGSAAALSHAAAALATTQTRLLVLLSGDPPSQDPVSLQSRCYQKIFADLNAAYRDAVTLAPTEIAVTLPPGESAERFLAGWDNMRDAAAAPGAEGAKTYPAGGGSEAPAQRLPAAVPAVPHMSGYARSDYPRSGHPGSGHFVSGAGSAGPPGGGGWPSKSIASSAEESRGGLFGEHQVVSPYEVGGTLASGGVAGVPGAPDPDPRAGDPSRPAAEPSEPNAAQPANGRTSGGRVGRAAGADANGLGAYPFGSRQRDEARERERRYYLKEERAVWGEPVAPPAVLYGQCPPPRSDVDIDDDDDDF